jgi:hypothetical protein
MRRMVRTTSILGLCLLWLSLAPAAQSRNSSAQATAPEPKDFFGFAPGTDYKVFDYERDLAYFRALDAASDRVVVEEIGKTTLGKTMIVALISSEANLKSRDRYREIARRLATARGTSEAEARALAKEGKAIVWIDGGMHSSEIANSQHMPDLAWWVATSETNEARRIRDNVIFLAMPTLNPDGLDIVKAWYDKQLGTPFETTSPPELYHHYIGHDNNRDWYMFTQVETANVGRQLYHRWFPQIVYNHHQSSPFPGRIWGPPMKNPVNPNLDPLLVSTVNQIGEHMRKRFDLEGKPGYVSGITFDMWWNGSMRGVPDFHNMAGYLTETALYRMATPRCYTADEVPDTFGEANGNMPAKTPTTDYTNPWLGGCWHLRDAVTYMDTASKATLDYAAKLKEDVLFNIWFMGKRQIERGEKAQGGPYAYVIDLAAQHDPTRTVEFLRTMRAGGIEVRQAVQPFPAGGKTYPAGTYVLGPQAFRPHVVDLMEPKTYPERRLYPGGPPDRPYDMTGYELSLQMGIKADRVTEAFPLPTKIVDEVPAAPGGVEGEGTVFTMSPNVNMGVKAVNRLLKAGARVAWAPDGTVVVSGVGRDVVDREARSLGVRVSAVASSRADTRAVRAPRVALYKSWMGNMDEGWTRWLLEQYEFTYKSVSNTDIRTGDLSQFDVLILADEDANRILNGHLPGNMPDEFVGGVGVDGAARIRAFVENGGMLLAWDGAIDFAISTLGLPLRNAIAETRPTEFFIPGTLVRIDTKPENPLAHGMERSAIAMFNSSQVLAVVPPAAEGKQRAPRNVDVFVEYAREDFLASGWELGGRRYLAGRVAGARVPVGKGQAVVYGFRPGWRGQPHNTFKLLFNPLYVSTMGTEAQTSR